MTRPTFLARPQLIDAIERGPVSDDGKARAFLALSRSEETRFVVHVHQRAEILKVFERRFARERPQAVSGEDTFLNEIALIPTDNLTSLLIQHSNLVTTIWLTEDASLVCSVLTGEDQSLLRKTQS